MSTENDTQFNEAADREYADWKRVRQAIEHENTLVNHRLTWPVLKLQGFLFAAFGWNGYASESTATDGFTLVPPTVICILGASISGLILTTLMDAKSQIGYLDCWWYSEKDKRTALAEKWIHHEPYDNHDLQEDMKKQAPAHPPLQACLLHTGSIRERFKAYNIPWLFVIAWAGMFIFVWRGLLSKLWSYFWAGLTWLI